MTTQSEVANFGQRGGQYYIGRTARTVEKRFIEHINRNPEKFGGLKTKDFANSATLADDFVRSTRIPIEGIADPQTLKGMEQIFLDAYQGLKPTGYNSIRAISSKSDELITCVDKAVAWLRNSANNALRTEQTLTTEVRKLGFSTFDDFITHIKNP